MLHTFIMGMYLGRTGCEVADLRCDDFVDLLPGCSRDAIAMRKIVTVSFVIPSAFHANAGVNGIAQEVEDGNDLRKLGVNNGFV